MYLHNMEIKLFTEYIAAKQYTNRPNDWPTVSMKNYNKTLLFL